MLVDNHFGIFLALVRLLLSKWTLKLSFDVAMHSSKVGTECCKDDLTNVTHLFSFCEQTTEITVLAADCNNVN